MPVAFASQMEWKPSLQRSPSLQSRCLSMFITLPQTNVEPRNWPMEKLFPLQPTGFGGSMLICRGSTFFLCIYVIWFDMLHMFFELGKTIGKAFILSLFDFNWQGVPCVNMCCWPSPQYPHQSDPLLCKVPSSSSVFASARASASSSSSKISKAQVKSGREPRVPPYFMDDKGYVYVQEHVDDKSICVGVFTSTSNTWFSSFRHMVLNS